MTVCWASVGSPAQITGSCVIAWSNTPNEMNKVVVFQTVAWMVPTGHHDNTIKYTSKGASVDSLSK